MSGPQDYEPIAKKVEELELKLIESEQRQQELTAQIRKMEARLDRCNQKLSDTQELALVGSWDWDINTGVVEWTNEVYRIFGLDPDQFQPQIKSVMSRFHPDDRKKHEDLIQQALQNRETYSFEASILVPNGNTRQVVSTSRGHYDDEGNLLRIFGTVHDVTDFKRIETDLLKSEQKYRALVESSMDLVWEVDHEGYYTYVSPQIENILGYKAAEVIGKTPFDLMGQKEAEHVKKLFRTALETKTPIVSLENENRHKNGNPIVLETCGVPIIGADGNVKGYIGVDRDITLRKQTEEALRQSNVRFRQVFENIGVGIAIYEAKDLGNDFIFKDINPYGVQTGEISREEHIGQSVLDVYPGVKELGLFKIFQEVWRTGLSKNHPISQYRDERISLWVENFVAKLPSGEVMAVYKDVTSERKAEEALRVSETKLRAVLDATPFPIALVDLGDDEIEYWSQSALELFGHTAGTASKWYEIAYPDPDYRQKVIEKWKPFLEIAQNSGKPVNTGEYRVTCKDGSERICQLYATFIPDNLIVTFNDITERKRTENELTEYREHLEDLVSERTAVIEMKNKELETFSYSVSHDLKAPLRGIDGYSRLLLEEYGDKLDDEGQTFLENVRKSAEQMNQLIEDLLAYSRMERRGIHTATIELAPLIKLLTSERFHDIESNQIEIIVSVPFESIEADADTLRQVIGNYLDNAIKFSKKEKHSLVEISGFQSETSWTIWVKDNGIGFDPQYHDRIFQIFQRLHRIEDYPGTGVGLAIVRKAVERVGGRVWAESSLGNGAKFFVDIPKNKLNKYEGDRGG